MSTPPGDASAPGDRPPPPPGSKAWVEQHHGPTADFTDRIPAGIIDAMVPGVVALASVVVGLVLVVAGFPETYPCPSGLEGVCVVDESGSGPLVAAGIVMFVLAVVLSIAIIVWNRVLRVVRTGQSLGKRYCGLRVIDATSGRPPSPGPALLRELVSQLAGIISWLWMLVDDEDRTLGDIVGHTHVVRVPQAQERRNRKIS